MGCKHLEERSVIQLIGYIDTVTEGVNTLKKK